VNATKILLTTDLSDNRFILISQIWFDGSEKYLYKYQKSIKAGRQWLTPVILATQEVEIMTEVQSQAGQIVHKTLSRTHPSQKKGWRSG
jgi:hypothetical protein